MNTQSALIDGDFRSEKLEVGLCIFSDGLSAFEYLKEAQERFENLFIVNSVLFRKNTLY